MNCGVGLLCERDVSHMLQPAMRFVCIAIASGIYKGRGRDNLFEEHPNHNTGEKQIWMLQLPGVVDYSDFNLT